MQGGKRVLKRDFKQKREANWEEHPNRAQNWGELELKNPDFEEYYKAQACDLRLVPASIPCKTMMLFTITSCAAFHCYILCWTSKPALSTYIAPSSLAGLHGTI